MISALIAHTDRDLQSERLLRAHKLLMVRESQIAGRKKYVIPPIDRLVNRFEYIVDCANKGLARILRVRKNWANFNYGDQRQNACLSWFSADVLVHLPLLSFFVGTLQDRIRNGRC